MKRPEIFQPEWPVRWCKFRPDTIVAATPKVAQTSIRRAGVENTVIPMADAPKYPNRHVFVRNPLARLESCYHYHQERSADFTAGNQWPWALDGVSGEFVRIEPESYEDFVDLVLDDHMWNKHWVPQVWLWDDLATEYHLFEDVAKVCSSLGRPIEHENASRTPKTAPEYRIEELREFFADDLRIREDLLPLRR